MQTGKLNKNTTLTDKEKHDDDALASAYNKILTIEITPLSPHELLLAGNQHLYNMPLPNCIIIIIIVFFLKPYNTSCATHNRNIK